MSRSSDHRSQD